MYKNNFMYSLLTCLIHAMCVIVTVYYHPIKSLNSHFNCLFDLKYLFMFYIISSTYHHQNIKKNSINPMGWFPWILCQPEWTCACNDGHTHTQYAQSGHSCDGCTQYIYAINLVHSLSCIIICISSYACAHIFMHL